MKKIIFKNSNVPVEIFCNEKYKDYYIRGQVIEFSDNIYFDDKHYGYAFYHLVILALVNDEYLKRVINDRDYWEEDSPNLFFFFGKTKKEFLEWIKKYTEEANPPIVLSKKEINVIENSYLNNAIESNKEKIFLSMNLYLDRIEHPKDRSLMPNNKRIFSILAYHFTDTEHFEIGASLFLYELFELSYFNLDYNHLDRKEYLQILKEIGELGLEWLEKKTVSKEFLQSLNDFNKSICKREYPLTDFCYKFFDDLVDDLTAHKQIKQCEFCGDFFKYAEAKKYCSPLSEGKDCGKKARNKRDYEKHKDKRRSSGRKATQETRAFYKERGIKK